MKGFRNELEQNILPFWLMHMVDHEHGGFYGQLKGDGTLVRHANKGLVLNARLLWTFSCAYRVLKRPVYLVTAERAYHYLTTHFYDTAYGGFYWEVDHLGKPVNTKKQTYAQAFALYGLAEFYKITQRNEVLQLARETFAHVESRRDRLRGGYYEAFSQQWQDMEDVRLSTKDANEKKSMNTHLHLLEAYSNMLIAFPNPEIQKAHRHLAQLFIDRLIDPVDYRIPLFFNENWEVKSSTISYGHDIESSWLLAEAAELADLPEIRETANKMAEATLEGLLPDGSLCYERQGIVLDKERHWWVQAEAVVGYMYAWRRTKAPHLKMAAERAWHYIQTQLIDQKGGEWLWSRLPDGTVNKQQDKAGFWKCPYHNGRMCLEMIEKFGFE